MTRDKRNAGQLPADAPLQGVALVRLECLRLAHRPDKSEVEVIARAKALEHYVTTGQAPEDKEG